MNIFSTQIANINRDTQEISIFLPWDDETVVARMLHDTPINTMAASAGALPYKYSVCMVLEMDGYYYILGYYNYPTGGNMTGNVIDTDLPNVSLGEGDWTIRHGTGNYLLHGKEFFHAHEGIGASLRLTGGDLNKFNLLSYRMLFDTTAGYLKWEMDDAEPGVENPAHMQWLVKKNFEQNVNTSKSDYVDVRMGAIPIEDTAEYADHIFSIKSFQYEGGTDILSEVSLTLSKDTENRFLNLNTIDNVVGANTNLAIYDAYNIRLNSTDSIRNTSVSMLNADRLLDIDLDTNVVLSVDNTGEIDLVVQDNVSTNFTGNYFSIVDGKISWVCTDINLGEETGAESGVLGDTLVSILTELVTIFNAHIHPTGTGPSGPPTSPWNPALETALSGIVRLS